MADRDTVCQLLQAEEEGAFIRSREQFIEGGEKPGYFHKCERDNARQKYIKEIRNKEGILESGENVKSVFHQFFSELYTCDSNVDLSIQDVFLNSFESRVGLEDSELLDRPIQLDEIRKVLTCMSRNKSPGIDGLPVEFYYQFFDIVGKDLLLIYNEIFEKEILTKSQRTAVITLLPKKGDCLDPGNKRPISLLTCDYKIISKVIQMRLSTVLPDIVGVHQACSVPGRNIHSNLLFVEGYCRLHEIEGICLFPHFY